MTPWIRRTLRQYGLPVPFTALVCPRYLKLIEIDDRARVDVRVERMLVFLKEPAEGDLRDVIPLAPNAGGEIYESPDSRELRRTTGENATTVYWAPRERIVPYGLYVHSYGWSSPGYPGEAAVYTEFRCDTRTAVAELELKGPGAFEAAVAFRWPPWRRLGSVQRLVKYALDQLESSDGQRPEALDDGSRLRWSIASPQVGERYACVAFHDQGVALWQKRIAESTLPARMRRLVKGVTSF